ncbi:hypothetical protein BZA05DRAFT_209442 [Tricharina praecox]|uniref:uncharacterized protein n=1 Tax=Tricharina praecox TaxID=43433 RepID=UPI00221FFC36|nr:uncharacterized protein BZA05DRAFT_209442 [Tricharina praecox]KAI5842007.1 hypothetical protein BZA05DRAFT_209442 [Tricharina praecox]
MAYNGSNSDDDENTGLGDDGGYNSPRFGDNEGYESPRFGGDERYGGPGYGDATEGYNGGDYYGNANEDYNGGNDNGNASEGYNGGDYYGNANEGYNGGDYYGNANEGYNGGDYYTGHYGGSGYNSGGTGSTQLVMASSRHPPQPMPRGHGYDPNAYVQGQPALIHAMRRGDSRGVESLIRSGASIDHFSFEHHSMAVQYIYQTQNRQLIDMVGRNNAARHARGAPRPHAFSPGPGRRSSSRGGRWPVRGDGRGHWPARGDGRGHSRGDSRGHWPVRGDGRGHSRGDGRGHRPFRANGRRGRECDWGC